MAVYTYPRLNLQTPPMVSIIIPTFNEEDYIRQTLVHARAQKYSGKFEIIISDCRSTDQTRAIGNEIADQVLSCSKRNTAAARNVGADNAKGDFLLFVDADTWLPPNYLNAAYDFVKKDMDLVALSTAFQFTPRTPFLLLLQWYINLRFWAKDRLFHRAPVLGYNLFIRKDAFFKNGKFQEVFFEDLYFYQKLNLTRQHTRYFLQPKVTISARRLQKYGFIKTYVYYNTRRALTERYLFDSWYRAAT